MTLLEIGVREDSASICRTTQTILEENKFFLPSAAPRYEPSEISFSHAVCLNNEEMMSLIKVTAVK
jgi:hypothetical protein